MSTITFIPVIPKTQLQALAKNRGFKLSRLINDALSSYLSAQSSEKLSKQTTKTKQIQSEFNQLLQNIAIPAELKASNIDDLLSQDLCK